MRFFLLMMLPLLFVAGCGGGSVKPRAVVNPYAEQMKVSSLNGVDAMLRERWPSAENSFERALRSAQLSGNAPLIATAWYNLGLLQLAVEHSEQAKDAFQQAKTIALDDDLPLILMRSHLALGLIDVRAGKQYPAVHVLDKQWPVDVYMSAARLAQLQDKSQLAQERYQRVLRYAGDSQRGLKFAAEAYMGLAQLAYARDDKVAAKKFSKSALQGCQKIGAPRLMAHVLLFRASLDMGKAEQRKSLQQARDVYRILHDVKGQRDSVQKLMLLAEQDGDEEQLKTLRHALSQLDKADHNAAVGVHQSE